MKIALGTKVKLCLINGKIEKLTEQSLDFEHWNRVDCVVMFWILNSISKDSVEAC